MSLQRIASEPVKHTISYVFGTPRNLLLGAGLHYSIEREEYTHIPLILFFPSVYAGYHAHKNKDLLLNWIIGSKKKMKGTWI